MNAGTLHSYRSLIDHHGWTKAFHHFLHKSVNRTVYFEKLFVIALERTSLNGNRVEDPRVTSRLATADELNQLEARGDWQITPELRAAFAAGDSCLLSCVDGEPAGYTWVHTHGEPELLRGVRLRLPDGYLYNYAGFTHPNYRGFGLQSHRHHAVLQRAEWSDRTALLGYVLATNFASRRGQAKSGYVDIGTIRLLGSRERFLVWPSAGLRNRGIGRI